MNLHKFTYGFCAFAMFISCSSEGDLAKTAAASEMEPLLTEQEAKVLFRMRESDNRIGMDEITRLADGIIGFLNGENALKSGPNRRVNSISALVSENKPVALKSSGHGDVEIPDTLAYILNFNDSLGFAIISADTRIDDPILAFTDNGTLIDSTDNPGIALFLEYLEDYMVNSIAEAERQKDSLLAGIIDKFSDEADTKAGVSLPILREVSRRYTDQVGPLVPVEWGQDEPFSNNVGGKCITSTGIKKYPAGCVATATAQIMAYWKQPPVIVPYILNWAELSKYTARPGFYTNAGKEKISDIPDNISNQLANLFYAIGKGVGMSYSCGGSSVQTQKAIDFLKIYGFKADGLNGYDLDKTVTSLNKKWPLIAKGCSKEIKTVTKFLGITVNTSYSYDGCHAWVIDGYLKQQITYELVKEASTMTIIADAYYIHNNWGWNGSRNGYFASGIFNSNLTPISSSTTKSDEPYNYQYEIKATPIYR